MRSLYPIDLRRRCFLNLDIPGDDKKASKRVSKPASFFLSIHLFYHPASNKASNNYAYTHKKASHVCFVCSTEVGGGDGCPG